MPDRTPALVVFHGTERIIRAVRRLPRGVKFVLLAAAACVLVAAQLSRAPYAQDPAFHMFAETRAWLGVPFVGDVISNLPYAIVGALGLAFILGPRGRSLFADDPRQSWPYITFFTGVVFLSIGSAYYHWAPTNETLLWDRLALSIAFMAVFAAFIADRVHARAGVFAALPILVALGFASVLHWHLTESTNQGDLRLYYLVQLFPIVIAPLICLLFEGRITDGRYLHYMIGWYAAALACETFDHEIYRVLGRSVSGHTIKHLLAAIAIYMVLAMLRSASVRSRDGTDNAGSGLRVLG